AHVCPARQLDSSAIPGGGGRLAHGFVHRLRPAGAAQSNGSNGPGHLRLLGCLRALSHSGAGQALCGCLTDFQHPAPRRARSGRPVSVVHMSSQATSSTPAPPWSRGKRLAVLALGMVLVYLAIAYLIAPMGWKRYARKHPSLEDIPDITHTGS